MADHNKSYEIGQPVEHRTLSFYAKPEPRVRIGEGFGLGTAEPAHVVEEPPAPGIPETAVEKRAIWVVHGMGQQVPFETVDALAQGVIKTLESKTPHGWIFQGPPRMVATKFSSPDDPARLDVVQRVELTLGRTPPSGRQELLELHLYEAYWAPVTEGVAKLSDVLSFLFDGALHGLLNCVRPFRRVMFPKDTSNIIGPYAKYGKSDDGAWNFRIHKLTATEIVLLLLLVAALAAMNAVIIAASAAKLKFPILGPWPVSSNWDQLTAMATAITALALTLGAVLYLAEMTDRAKAGSFIKSLVCVLTWITLGVTATVLLVGAALMTLVSWLPTVALRFQGMRYHAIQFVSTTAIFLAVLLCGFASRRRAFKKGLGKEHASGTVPKLLFLGGCLLHAVLLGVLIYIHYSRYLDPWVLQYTPPVAIDFLGSGFWVWPSLLYLSKQLSNIIVEYPGDVAIYVAPNKLDRFSEARQKIKQLALESLMPLYSARRGNSNAPLYSKIALVGHSLGSVIAYDTLNRLLALDDLLDPVNPPIGVANRTCVLETFGSPLDKTAFFFSYQGTESFNIREQLAASVQPLIQDYAKYRRFPWINVYNRNDVICGFLKFYDVIPPAANPPGTHRVDNVHDPDAVVPLIAHVEYWKNDILWDKLLQHVL